MFERFSDDARRVVVLAQDESRALSHRVIDTEHLLLGLLAQQQGAAARALADLGVGLADARSRVARLVPPDQAATRSSGHIPFTAGAKRVLEGSLRETLRRGDRGIGTGHLLLALVAVPDGVHATVLSEAGVTADAVAAAVQPLLDEEMPAPSDPDDLRSRVTGVSERLDRIEALLHDVVTRLDRIERRLGPGADEPGAGRAS